MGRHCKLTPELQKKFIDAIVAGNYIDAVCDYVGIGIETYYRWMNYGEIENDPDMLKYVEFRDAVKKARAAAEIGSVTRIRQAASGELRVKRKVTTKPDGTVITEESIQPPNWQADAWFLERSFPQKWGKRTQIEFVTDKPLEELTDNEISALHAYKG